MTHTTRIHQNIGNIPSEPYDGIMQYCDFTSISFSEIIVTKDVIVKDYNIWTGKTGAITQ